MEFKKYKMAMRNRISPKNRDFVIDRERAPFDDNVSNLGEQPVFSQNEFTTTPMIDPAEFPARKEYMQLYAVGGRVNFSAGSDFNDFLKTLSDEKIKNTSTQDLIKLSEVDISPTNAANVLKKFGFRDIKPSRELSKDKKAEIMKALEGKKGRLESVTYEGKDYYIGSDGRMREVRNRTLEEKVKLSQKQRTNPNRKVGTIFSGTTNPKLIFWESLMHSYNKTLNKENPRAITESRLIPNNKKNIENLNPTQKKKIVFFDKKTNKTFGYNDLEKYMEENIGKNSFKNAIDNIKTRTFLNTTYANVNGNAVSLRFLLNETLIPGWTETNRLRNVFNVHHPYGYSQNPFVTQLAFFDSNNKEYNIKTALFNKLKDEKTLSGKKKLITNFAKSLPEGVLSAPGKKIYGQAFDIETLLNKAAERAELAGNKDIKEIFQSEDFKKDFKTVFNRPLEDKSMPQAQQKIDKPINFRQEVIPEKQVGEINDYVKSLSDDLNSVIGCSNSNKFQTRSKLTRTKNSVGGRIGFADGPKPGNGCIEKGKKKLEEGRIGPSELNAVEKSLTESGKMTPAAKKFFTAAKTAARVGGKIPLELISIGFGPAGVVAGALLELATVQDDLMRGDLKEAWRNTFPGMILKGAGDLVGLDLVGSKRKDILKFAKNPEEIAAVNSMFNYLEGTEKFNEMLGDIESDAGDVSTFEQYQDPESQFMVSEASRRVYDLEDQAKKLKAILDAQEKDLGTAEGQRMSIDVLRREIEGRYPMAKKLNPNLSLEQFVDDEINRIYFGIQKQAAPIPDVIDPDTQFNLMNPVRQPFAGGGLSIQDKIQELLASIPGLMIADFVPVSEKVELKRLFDQFNDRYMRKAEGGRIGFKNGPEDINKSRRLFNQLLLGLAALPVVGKYLKLGRGAGKVANITINKTAGMPDFFEPLVNKVINEGIDITKKMGTQERQTVHMADIADHEVTVYRQLDTGEIDVYINGMKTLYQDAVRLYYKPGQISEEASRAAGKPIKEADEFIAQESSPAYSGSPEDYEVTSDGTFETNNFNELASDLTEVEAAVMKQPVTELQKRKKLDRYKYYESKEGQQKLLDEQYGEYDDTMRDDIIDE
jgi:hypothetical protein